MDGGRVIPFATVLEELLNSEGRFSLAQASGPVAKAGGGDLSRNKGGSRRRLNSSWPVEAACPLAKAAAATTAPPLLAKLEMIKEAEEQPVEAACGGSRRRLRPVPWRRPVEAACTTAPLLAKLEMIKEEAEEQPVEAACGGSRRCLRPVPWRRPVEEAEEAAPKAAAATTGTTAPPPAAPPPQPTPRPTPQPTPEPPKTAAGPAQSFCSTGRRERELQPGCDLANEICGYQARLDVLQAALVPTSSPGCDLANVIRGYQARLDVLQQARLDVLQLPLNVEHDTFDVDSVLNVDSPWDRNYMGASKLYAWGTERFIGHRTGSGGIAVDHWLPSYWPASEPESARDSSES